MGNELATPFLNDHTAVGEEKKVRGILRRRWSKKMLPPLSSTENCTNNSLTKKHEASAQRTQHLQYLLLDERLLSCPQLVQNTYASSIGASDVAWPTTGTSTLPLRRTANLHKALRVRYADKGRLFSRRLHGVPVPSHVQQVFRLLEAPRSAWSFAVHDDTSFAGL